MALLKRIPAILLLLGAFAYQTGQADDIRKQPVHFDKGETGTTIKDKIQGDLSESGDYTIRVYLMRNAARRNEAANYTLEVAIAAAGDVPSEANDGKPKHSTDPVVVEDALVAGTPFNATAEIPCASQPGQPMRNCRVGVIRQDGGSTTVRVFWPEGGERNLYFQDGKAISSDAESGEAVATQRNQDLNKISIGKSERFEIPDALLYGD